MLARSALLSLVALFLTTTTTSAGECKCDHRGTQIEEQYGNWCYIKETPCYLLNGALTYLHWQRCHEFGNTLYQELIKCPSISPFYQFLHRGRCKNGYACETRDCNTIEATVMDCRNRCASRGEHIGYFAYVPATQVCACYTKEGKCGDDWKYQNTLNEYYWDHHWAFEILRPTDVVSQDCVTADIGLGKDSKTIPMEFGYQCPEIVNITNWIGRYKWPDTFSVEQTAKQITVKRTDSTDGWGMHLRFQCCKVEKCIDDMNWKDSKYGDGKSKCSDMTQDWCQNRGDYSIEALKSCPRSCGVCKGCTTALVGPKMSHSLSSKTISFNGDLKCPNSIDKTSWLEGYTWPDTFSVSQAASSLTVTRTDSNYGWWMDLKFVCCKEELECHDNCNDGPCCLNGGKCTENRSGNICICPPRFMGQYCEIALCDNYCWKYIIDALYHPNGRYMIAGTCKLENRGPKCYCTVDYYTGTIHTGIRCEHRKEQTSGFGW